MKSFFQIEKNRHYLLLIVLPIIVFYPISFGINPMKYDMIDCFLPWRFNVVEHLKNGQLPFWNPFQDLGYPIQADPSSGAWYPIVWIFGSLFSYSLYSIGWEYVIHLIFAGIGFYKLLHYFSFPRKLALIGAMAYAFCGIFIGNAQHLPYIVSACWLPFLLLFYLKTLQESSWINPIKAALFLYLLLTGGYPAFIIILLYLLLLFLSIHIWQNRKEYNRQLWVQLILRNGLLGFLAILFSLPLFIGIYQVSPYLSRLGKFALEDALFSPFSPQCFISFFSPYATATITDFYDSDLAMRNGYFGLFLFLFFIPAIFIKKSQPIKILFYFGVFSLTASVGTYLPVRTVLFNYVPMMGVFRFPSVFRYFFILAAIPTSLIYVKVFFDSFSWRKVHTIFGLTALFLIGIIAFSRSNGYLELRNFFNEGLFNYSENSTIYQHLTLQAFFHICLIFGLYIAWRFINYSKIQLFIIFFIIELFVTTQLIIPYTVCYDTISIEEGQNNLTTGSNLKQDLNTKTIEIWDHYHGIGTPFWQNEGIFQNLFLSEGFNSFSFSSYEDLENDHPYYFSQLIKNRVTLLSDHVCIEKAIYQREKDTTQNLSSSLFFNANDRTKLNKFNLKHISQDTSFLKHYSLNEFEVQYSAKNTQLLTLFQKYYTGWKAFQGDKEIPIYKSSGNFMSVIAEPNHHSIRFVYDNPIIRWSFWFSLLGLVVAIWFLISSKSYKINKLFFRFHSVESN